MIRTKTSSSLPLKDHVSMKLAVLFGITFSLVFFGGLVYDLFASQADSLMLNATVTSQPPVTTIDPKLESDLAKVIDFDDVPNSAEIKDPFTDQGGISNNAKTAEGTVTPSETSTTTPNPNNRNAVVANSTRKTPVQPNVSTSRVEQNTSANNNTSTNNIVPEVDTKMRFQMREEKIRVGQDGGPESAVFAIDDLLPVGVVSGGAGVEEVMFYSAAADRTFSFPIGTRFFDGWLAELRPEGVVFGFTDQFHTMRLKSWGRSIRTKNSEKVSVIALPNQVTGTGGSN